MMMDEMTKMVADKTGMSMEQSKMAVQTMMDFMMSKMPEGMGKQVHDMMMGEGMMGDMGKMMGGMDKTMGDMGKMAGDMGKRMGDMGGKKE